MSIIHNKISRFKELMLKSGLDACIIPTSDPHLSEYLPDHWKSREWLSGFTGSTGTLVVTSSEAFLWTDARYFLQAEAELQGSPIALKKLVQQGAPEYIAYLCTSLSSGAKVGLDFSLFSKDELEQIQLAFDSNNIEAVNIDLVPAIWIDRPSTPNNKIFIHDIKFHGVSIEEKLNLVRQKMMALDVDSYLITALDEIAWMTNTRGSDVECNPVYLGYILLTLDSCTLFISQKKIDSIIVAYLNENDIDTQEYENIYSILDDFPKNAKILLDPSKVNAFLFDKIAPSSVIRKKSPITQIKSIKNEIEIANIRKAMEKDGVAILKTHRWLISELEHRDVPETDVANQLIVNRKKQANYFGESFNAIIGYNENGAIIHYKPEEGSCLSIKSPGILLIDSGGQYLDGTTDITRTWIFGEPTHHQKKMYTLVLKGHILLSRAVFPSGTKGVQLDVLARYALWQNALNYEHGTGHGVGFFLNVHEPPQGFVSGLNERGTSQILEGSLTSNEPGYYEGGQFGIRLENLVLARKKQSTRYGDFLCFETMTLYPFELSLIDLNLLNLEEKEWINDYHQAVLSRLTPYLNNDEVLWLEQQCTPIPI